MKVLENKLVLMRSSAAKSVDLYQISDSDGAGKAQVYSIGEESCTVRTRFFHDCDSYLTRKFRIQYNYTH